MSHTACEAEKNLKDACGVIRNGSPAGESPMRETAQCEVTDDEDAGRDASCNGLPFVHLTELVSSNLGKAGPDKDAEEGIIYKATAHHTGLDIENLQIHVHSLKNFGDTDDERTFDDNYKPAFTKGKYINGINGHFGVITVKANESLKVRVHAYDADKEEDVEMPHGAISFFDLDTGKKVPKDGEKQLVAVEHVEICEYHSYFLTNETQVKAVKGHNDECMKFSATSYGSGSDNPSNPLELTREQKDKAVTIKFENRKTFDFEIGASEGCDPKKKEGECDGGEGRVFSFVLRPSLLCAKTKMPDGALLPAKGKTAPVEPEEVVRKPEPRPNLKKSDAYHQLPSVVLILGIVSYFV